MQSLQPITYFRPRRPGPEAVLEDTVALHIPRLFSHERFPSWTAGSVPVGAGMPDLLIATYAPQVFALANLEIPETHILAYLHAVRSARFGTLVERMHLPDKVLTRRLYRLIDADVVAASDDTFFLAPAVRNVLPEIVTVEVKVSNWQRAVRQAERNRLFAHRSFVALPRDVARRVKNQEAVVRSGIGVLSVAHDGVVTVNRRARRAMPCVWTYYYYLAFLVAKNETTDDDAAVHRCHCRR